MAGVHNLPPTPVFRDEPLNSPIFEFALRVIVERANWQFDVVGTATLIAGHLAVTARHVLEYALRTFGGTQVGENKIEISTFELKLYQVLPGPVYRIWRVVNAWPCDTDIVLLHLGLDRATSRTNRSPGNNHAYARCLHPQDSTSLPLAIVSQE